MMASSTAVASSEGELRQRSQPASSQEEKLIERLDAFLSSIESRLDNFDQFFRFQQQETAAKEAAAKAEPVAPSLSVPATPSHSRRGSASSMSSIKQFSMNNLNNVYTRLRLIKKQVLSNSFTNLDYLYNTLAQQYDSIFNEDLGEFVSVAKGASRELLSEKIITTIQYFDEKLLAIDDFIKPHASSDYSAAVEYNHLRFFNFNKALKEAVNKRIHYYQLPLSWRENKYIVYGYRFSLSHWTMAKSVLQVNHNEFVNIWTHFIGFLVMAYLQFVHFPSTAVYAANSWTDNAFWCLFFFAAYQCLLGSCVWHTYSTFAHYPTRANCACIDYTGITVLITNSVLLAEYASLYHHPKLMRAIGGFSVTCGLAGFAFNWSSYFDRPECRSLRIGFFIGLAASGVSAMLCQAFYQGVFSAARFHFPLVWKSFVWYLGGTVFYGGLFPERWRYDVVFPDDGTHCHHEYDASDVLTDKVGHDGEEELEQLEDDLQRTETESQFDALVQKYFPAEPKKTPYANDFMSLWWVDYIGSSHNIWHVCVVLGVVGHYFGMLDLFSQVSR
ncbi:ADIPOR-like receptor Izh3p [Diutina catenulata]